MDHATRFIQHYECVAFYFLRKWIWLWNDKNKQRKSHNKLWTNKKCLNEKKKTTVSSNRQKTLNPVFGIYFRFLCVSIVYCGEFLTVNSYYAIVVRESGLFAFDSQVISWRSTFAAQTFTWQTKYMRILFSSFIDNQSSNQPTQKTISTEKWRKPQPKYKG